MRYTLFFQGPLRNEAGDGDAGGGAGDGDAGAADLQPLLDENLNFAEGYQDRVGEHAAGATFKTLPDLFKSQVEATTTIRGLNQEKADLAKQLQDLGQAGAPPELPKTVEDFTAALVLPEAKDLPDGVVIPEQMVTAASQFAVDEGIAPDVVSKFIKFQTTQAGEQFQTEANAFAAKVQQATVDIKGAVGEQNYDLTVANAAAASEALGLQLSPDDLASSPTLVLSLAKVKDQLGEGALKGASLGTDPASITSGSKLQQANDIVSDENNNLHAAFHDNTHPNHQTAIQTHSRLISESDVA